MRDKKKFENAKHPDEIKRVQCPQCGKLTELTPANVFRPFCSERCKLIDLGEWASGQRFIPSDHDPSSEQD